MTWLRAKGNDALLTLHIQPGAKKTEIVGPHGDALKLRLAAPPVDGKANDALLAFLAKRFDIPKARLTLVSGLTSRRKSVRIMGIDVALVERTLRTDGD